MMRRYSWCRSSTRSAKPRSNMTSTAIAIANGRLKTLASRGILTRASPTSACLSISGSRLESITRSTSANVAVLSRWYASRRETRWMRAWRVISAAVGMWQMARYLSRVGEATPHVHAIESVTARDPGGGRRAAEDGTARRLVELISGRGGAH